jgi:hypothetical protein
MGTMSEWIEANKFAAAFMIAMAIGRGLMFPDFRYSGLSVMIIQLVFPAALLLPLFLWKSSGSNLWAFASCGSVAIIVSQLIAVLIYVWSGGPDKFDIVSQAIFGQSLVAMLLLFWMLLCVARFVMRWQT